MPIGVQAVAAVAPGVPVCDPLVSVGFVGTSDGTDIPGKLRFQLQSITWIQIRIPLFREPAIAPVVEARSGNVRVPEPLLDLRDVGLVLEGIGCGGGPQSMHADDRPNFLCVSADEFVDSVTGDRPIDLTGSIVSDRSEDGA